MVCEAFVFLAMGIVLLTVIGHGFWLVFAAIFRFLGKTQRREDPWPRGTCVRCGTLFDRRVAECPSCGLEPWGPVATELRELEITMRQIQALIEKQALEPSAGEQIYRLLEARQTELIQATRPLPAAPHLMDAPLYRAVLVASSSLPAADTSQPGAKEPEELLPVEDTAPAVPVLKPVPASPRRSLGEMLAGFMEERNILWGELVGGLLIVGCSIALVISLWQTLEQIPYFPFLIFASLTAALFGAGHYTLRHWKLESTSRGLLVIATLLTPLDFLVVAGLSRGQELGGTGLAIEITALVAFTLLVLLAARVLVGGALPALLGKPEDWLTLAVMGCAGSQLLVPRWISPGQTTGLFLSLAFLPVVCQVLALGAVLLPLARRERLEGTAANALFLFLGQATFAVAVALGFLVHRSEDGLNALRHLAMPIALGGMPILLTGGLVHRLLEKEPAGPENTATEQRGLSPGVARLVGTVTTLTGMLVMLGALVLAWPRTTGLIVVGGVNALAFTVAALRYRLPQAHVPALVCLAVASLTAFHALRGNLGANVDDPEGLWLTLAMSGSSGSLLAGLAIVLATTAELGARWRQHLDALYHLVASAVAAGLGLVLAGLAGAAEPQRAAIVFGVCGIGCLVVNLRWRFPDLSSVGSVVLLGAIGFALHWINPNLTETRLLLLMLLIEATVLLALSLGLPRLLAKSTVTFSLEKVYVVPFRVVGLTASVLAVIALALAVSWSWLPNSFLCALWLAGLWLVVAWLEDRPELFQAFQAALTLAVFLGISAWLHDQEWVGGNPQRLLRPRSLQAYALGLAALSLAWSVVRHGFRLPPHVRDLVEPGWRTVDVWVLASLVVGQFLLIIRSILPEVAREYVTQPRNDLLPLLGMFNFTEAWIIVGLLGLALTLDLWGNRPHESVLGWVILGLTVPLLVGHAFAGEHAVASALRWALSLSFLGYSGLLWARRPLWRMCETLGIGWPTSMDIPQWIRSMLLLGAVLPVLFLTGWVAVLGFSGQQPAGPDAISVFAHMGWTASTVTPLLVLVLVLVGHGLRENSAEYVAGAGYLLTATLMGGYALGVVTGGGTIAGAETAFILQLGILTIAVWGLAWLASGRWRNLLLLAWQVSLDFLFCLGLGLITLPSLLSGPVIPVPIELQAFLLQAGSLAGWMGLLATLSLSGWYTRLPGSGWKTIHVLGIGGFLVGILAACTAARWDVDGWLAYHTLSLTWAMVGLVLLTCGWAGDSLRRVGPVFWSHELRTRAAALLKQVFPVVPTRFWVEGFGLIVVLVALGESMMEPAHSYWSCAAPLAVSVLLGADAVWSRRPALVYVSGLLLNVSGYLLWRSWVVSEWDGWGEVGGQPGQLSRLLYLQILCLAVASSCWSLLELKLRHLATPIDLRSRWVPFVHAAVLAAVHLLALLILIGIVGDLTGAEIHVAGPLSWTALAATLVAAALCFWDPEATWWGLPLAPLYLTGLLFLGLVLHNLALSPRELASAATPLLGGYLAAAAATVWLAPRGARLWRRLRIPDRTDAGLTPWFLPAQALLGLLVLGLSLYLCLDFPSLAQRLSGPAGAALLTLAGLIMTACWPRVISTDLVAFATDNIPRQITLTLAALTVLELGWACLGLAVPVLWLHRNVLLLLVLSLSALVYRSGLAGRVNRESAWAINARQQGSVLAVLALGVLAGVLVQEFLLYDPELRRVPLAWPAALLVTGLLGVVLVGALLVAVSPRWDPFALSAKGKLRCVYVAELFLVLLLVHLRLNVPDLFPSYLSRHWALLLMMVGFIGVGLAELFQRRGLPMLAEPLQQTGLFLPLLPLIAFLVRPLSQLRSLGEIVPGFQPLLRYLDRLPAGFAMHSLLWFLLGLLYALVAILRRSSVFALLAALAANFSLWVVYANVNELAFLLHPQLWLIPLGLILLSAEHLNRSRLSEPQSQGVRYLGLLLIYVSSTADMFIVGLGNSVLWPVVLAVLSIVGVLGGILLQVRAFLLSGVVFLFLVVFAQIWHAAVNRGQTWVWWASGIVLGAAILVLFALFEKRGNDVLRLYKAIKGWH